MKKYIIFALSKLSRRMLPVQYFYSVGTVKGRQGCGEEF